MFECICICMHNLCKYSSAIHTRVETGSGHLGYPDNWVTFCPGQAGLTWFIKYPGLTQILH